MPHGVRSRGNSAGAVAAGGGKAEALFAPRFSAAAGAVGQVAGQIAKLKGCKVIACAGAADKLDYVTTELGFDAAVDYKGKDAETLAADFAKHAPQGIDIFFDNVGGEILCTVF